MIVAFLQNQWFRDPERALELLKRYQQHEGGELEGRERFNRPSQLREMAARLEELL